MKFKLVIRQYFNGRMDLARMQSEVEHLFTAETIKLHHQFLKYLSGEKVQMEPTATQLRGKLHLFYNLLQSQWCIPMTHSNDTSPRIICMRHSNDTLQ